MKDKFLTKNMKNPGTGKEQIMCSEAEVIKAGKAVLGSRQCLWTRKTA